VRRSTKSSPVCSRVRAWASILLLAGGLAALAPPPAEAAQVVLTANQLTVDAQTGVLEASGSVRISDGRTVATGSRLTLNSKSNTATLLDGQVKDPRGLLKGRSVTVYFTRSRVTRALARGNASLAIADRSLTAGEVDLRLTDNQVRATGAVRYTMPPDIVVAGSNLIYDRAAGTLRLEGPVRVQTVEGTLTGRQLEATETLQQATVRGDVQASFAGITARAETAALQAKEAKVVLTGDVRVRQGSREMHSPRVTIFYRSRRVVAEGPTRLRIEDGGEGQGEPRP
jgi:lipopolysaccharide assembly outer membrane protein LptD (OstA)